MWNSNSLADLAKLCYRLLKKSLKINHNLVFFPQITWNVRLGVLVFCVRAKVQKTLNLNRAEKTVNLELSVIPRLNTEFLDFRYFTSQILKCKSLNFQINLELPNLEFSIFGKPNLEFSIFGRPNLEYSSLKFSIFDTKAKSWISKSWIFNIWQAMSYISKSWIFNIWQTISWIFDIILNFQYLADKNLNC